MKIYTKTGDQGKTSLVFGERISKADDRVEAYGTIDELNSLLGLVRSQLKHEEVSNVIQQIQTTLFHAGAEVSTPPGKEVQWKLVEEDIVYMEEHIDKWDSQIPPLTNFILPGGSQIGATLHLARTVARRAERCVVRLGDDVVPLVTAYLNRLSDFLFVSARYVNFLDGSLESPMKPNPRR